MTVLLLILLLNILLRTTLSGFPISMHGVVVGLSLFVTSQSRNTTSDGALDTVGDTTAQVFELALSFLSLSLTILFVAFALQTFGADETTDRCFGGADLRLLQNCNLSQSLAKTYVLVPAAILTVFVVHGNATFWGRRDAAQLG